MVGPALAHHIMACGPIAARPIQIAAARQQHRMNAIVHRARDRNHERAHRKSHHPNAFRIHFRPAPQIRNRLHHVRQHLPAHTLRHARHVDQLIVFAGAILVIVVALALANHVVRQHHRARARILHARVPRVPTRLVGAVTVHHHDSRNFAVYLLRPVHNGRNPQSVLRRIRHALRHHSRLRLKTSVVFRVEIRQRIGNKQRRANLLPQLLRRGIASSVPSAARPPSPAAPGPCRDCPSVPSPRLAHRASLYHSPADSYCSHLPRHSTSILRKASLKE